MPKSRKLPDRRVVYCLICNKPQTAISWHLAQRCMAQETPEQRQAEVVRAKRSMKRWTLLGRRWDYSLLEKCCKDPADRYRLLEHLEENDFLVIDPPGEDERGRMKAAAAASDKARQSRPAGLPSVEGPAVTEPTSPASSEEEAPETPTARVSKGSRRILKRLGMYQRVSSDDSLIQSYRVHLKEVAKIRNAEKEISNVCRWLRFLLPDADGASVEFVRSPDKVRAYVDNLTEARLNRATICMHLDNLLRFVAFVREQSGPEYDAECDTFAAALKSAMRGIRREGEPAKSAKLVIGPQTTLYHCQTILRRAQEDVTAVQTNLDQERHVTEENKTRLRQYCVALLLLKACVKPWVVENLQTREWLERTSYGGFVAVTCRRQDGHESSFALGEDDASLIETYFKKVRSGVVRDTKTVETHLFLYRSGAVITSAHVELCRLHRQ
ncbi:uncharacterized protein LOC118564815 [Fundulus heteroclitus]|uniref:uncharacterized protein LOC118564815 n=1 Tax=Fundulus heteroclitus TaxID=8078 RepID=UPI00165B81BC|nr:uncharacterized protein LOC118564815 [Fundulus heteroclitus]